ncbi:hypothetical protein TEA_028405 [Camellia sinensis var. sinensis]|uniref:Transmembrane protein n=1 Tax=Camellia sinensis var. sinensis TaxID=542762 RepID=A0A4S4D2X4_CAMSN|nr:hypothetical protein TEA_028405 [Camellia sinensis var. sinensis]
MAKKKTMTTMFMAMASLLVLLMISTFHVDSVLGGEMGGYARSSSSRSIHDTITVYSRQSYCTSIPRTTHQKLNSSSPSTDSKSERNAIMIAFFAVLFIVVMIFSSQSKDSVLMVQVAFDGATDQIERDLDLISMVSDTPTALGLHLMLSSKTNRPLTTAVKPAKPVRKTVRLDLARGAKHSVCVTAWMEQDTRVDDKDSARVERVRRVRTGGTHGRHVASAGNVSWHVRHTRYLLG